MESFFDVAWWIVRYLGEGITWFFQFEERLAMLLDDVGISNHHQLPILAAVNSIMIAVEIYFWYRVVTIRKFQNVSTPGFLQKIFRGRTPGYFDLALLAFAPSCQKFATFIFAINRKKYAWRGYVAMVVGGLSRVSIIAYLGHKYIWTLIVVMLLFRALDWIFNGRRKKVGPPKEPPSDTCDPHKEKTTL